MNVLVNPSSGRGQGCLEFFAAAAALFILLCFAPAAHAALDEQQQARIRGATFEVVMPKKEDPAIQYEKPLPFDLLPFKQRNDKYLSIGTAFALGDGRYATAGHVFMAFIPGEMGPPALRDEQGHIYPVAQVLKFSMAEDFVVFTLADDPQPAPLQPGPHPALHDTVYAVGNALGEGIIIRDGVYTSETPEERDGRWNWLQFSAAASPGNSGGPLIDQGGRVIGIVLGGVPGENYNRGVSIDQVLNAKDGVGLIDSRQTYALDIFDEHQTETIKDQLTLPLGFAAFAGQLNQKLQAFQDRLLTDLLRGNAEQIFPQGNGSHKLLGQTVAKTFPSLIVRQPDDSWDLREPARIDRADLGSNGFLATGVLKTQTLLHLRRPDDVDAAKFYADPKLAMDLILKGYPLYRSMATERIRVQSLGAAVQDAQVVDRYGRKWRLREWPMQFINGRVLLLWLPVPDGAVGLLLATGMNQLHAHEIDFKALADFVAVAYGGNLGQWRDFLGGEAQLPELFSSISLDLPDGRSPRYASRRCSVTFDPGVVASSPQNWLGLDLSFFPEGSGVVWDVAQLVFKEDRDSRNTFSVSRQHAPAPDLDDSYQINWQKLGQRQHPYDGAIVTGDDTTSIKTVVAGSEGKAGGVYLVQVEREGSASQDAMQARLDLALKGVKVLEH
jgi:hypothetical protein